MTSSSFELKVIRRLKTAHSKYAELSGLESHYLKIILDENVMNMFCLALSKAFQEAQKVTFKTKLHIAQNLKGQETL